MTHYAMLKSSRNIFPVIRLGKLLIRLGKPSKGTTPINTMKYDNRFFLFPKGANPLGD